MFWRESGLECVNGGRSWVSFEVDFGRFGFDDVRGKFSLRKL